MKMPITEVDEGKLKREDNVLNFGEHVAVSELAPVWSRHSRKLRSSVSIMRDAYIALHDSGKEHELCNGVCF